MLLNTQWKNIDNQILKEAIYTTSEHRNSLNIIKEWNKVVEILKNNKVMKKQWEKYQKDNFYAEGILYSDLIDSLIKIGEIFEK